jgi:hypothetical protein
MASVLGCSVPAFGGEFSFSDVPVKRSDFRKASCSAQNDFETEMKCGALKALYSSVKPGTKVAFRLAWGKGDRGHEDVAATFQIRDRSNGSMQVSETRNDKQILRGSSNLSSGEIDALLASAGNSGLWSERQPRNSRGLDSRHGMETIVICYDGIIIAGVDAQHGHAVSRNNCPPDSPVEPELLSFARTMLRIANAHYPEIESSGEYWTAELQSSL